MVVTRIQQQQQLGFIEFTKTIDVSDTDQSRKEEAEFKNKTCLKTVTVYRVWNTLRIRAAIQEYTHYALFKIKNKTENYRPVSLASIIGKIFKSVIRDSLVQHLESNHLIMDSQHGFRKRRSCLTNLLEFLEKVTSCVDTRDVKLGFFIIDVRFVVID